MVNKSYDLKYTHYNGDIELNYIHGSNWFNLNGPVQIIMYNNIIFLKAYMSSVLFNNKDIKSILTRVKEELYNGK